MGAGGGSRLFGRDIECVWGERGVRASERASERERERGREGATEGLFVSINGV